MPNGGNNKGLARWSGTLSTLYPNAVVPTLVVIGMKKCKRSVGELTDVVDTKASKRIVASSPPAHKGAGK